MPEPSVADAVSYVLMIIGATFLLCAAVWCVTVALERLYYAVARLVRRPGSAKVLPFAKKDRTYPRPKGAA